MTFPTFVFYFFSAVLVFAALRVITARNPVHAALFLVLAFFTSAGIWIQLQAEFLARYVNDRQKANPNERIALVGDFNFYQFNDGIMDVIGSIKGTPTMPGFEDLLNPDLINLVDLIKQEQRYSYVFSGNAQVLDHFLVNEALRKSISGFGFARINADFPEVLRNDPNRVERFSDHDPAVSLFTLY